MVHFSHPTNYLQLGPPTGGHLFGVKTMWNERDAYNRIFPTMLAVVAACMVVAIMVIDVLGMVAQR